MRLVPCTDRTKAKLGYHFQQLMNSLSNADLPPEHLEVVELLVAAKQRCWEVIDGKPKGHGLTTR